MRLVLLAGVIGCALVLSAPALGASSATLAVPEPGGASVLVVQWKAGIRGPRVVLPGPAPAAGIVAASSVRRGAKGWTAVVVLGLRPGDAAAGARPMPIRWRARDAGAGRAIRLENVGRATRRAAFCPLRPEVAATARRAVWARSTLGRGTAPAFAIVALAAACSPGDAGLRRLLARLYGSPAVAGAKPGAPSPDVPRAPSPGVSPPPPPPLAPGQPPAAPPSPPVPPVPPALALTLAYRHATGGSHACVGLDVTAGAKVVLRLSGSSSFTSVTTIPSARASQTVAIPIYEPGSYALTATATKDGLVTQATGVLVVATAQGTGTCGPAA